MQIYGSFERFPLQWCIVLVGNITTPVKLVCLVRHSVMPNMFVLFLIEIIEEQETDHFE